MRATIASSSRSTFSSLHHRNFRLFFIGQSISNSGNWLTNVALTLFVLKIAGTGVGVGFLAACQFGPLLFLSAWGGAVADRVDKRRMLLLTQTLEMLQSMALSVFAFMPHPPLAGLYALAALGGVLLSLDNPLRRSFVAEMVPAADLPNAVVLYSTIVNLSRIFGPSLAGLLVVTTGFGWCFAIDALSYVAVIWCLVIMRPEELHRHGRRDRPIGGVRDGLRYAWSVPTLRVSFAMLAAITMLGYNFTVTLPLFVTRGLGASERVFTTIYSVMAFGSVASALIVARRGHVTMRYVTTAAASLGGALMLLAASPGVAWAALAAFLTGGTSLAFMTANTTVVQLEARGDMHGRMLALQTVCLGASALVGGPLLGWIADALGGRAVMVVGGVTCLVAAALGSIATAN